MAGALLVVARDPRGAAWLTAAAVLLAASTTRSLGGDWRLFRVLGVAYPLLAVGGYALHLLGVPERRMLGVAAALAGLVVAILGRALIAGGGDGRCV